MAVDGWAGNGRTGEPFEGESTVKVGYAAHQSVAVLRET
jgi:hypothetical protein